MNQAIFCLLVFCSFSCQGEPGNPDNALDRSTDAQGEPDAGWIPLFNGKNLDGWTPKITGYALGDNFGNTFRVVDGVLQVRYDQYENFDGRFGHLFFDSEFSHYLLRMEYRFVGEQKAGGPGWAWRNSGAMVHSQNPRTMKIEQDFPVCIEFQTLGSNWENTRSNANLCTPGTHVTFAGELDKRHCINSESEPALEDAWQTVIVEVRGGSIIRHWANGELVMQYTDPVLDSGDETGRVLWEGRESLSLDSGYIALQSESHPVDFRRVEIRVLDPEDPLLPEPR